MGFLGKLACQVEAAPSSDYMKNLQRYASVMAGGLFMTGPHHDVKWMIC